jgi:hypothetical protein
MRRFYVVPKKLLYEEIPGRDHKYHDLFMSVNGGAHFIELDDVHILLCCEEFGRADHEDLWHSHPDVARLHHGESDEPMHRLLHPDNDHKKFEMKHQEALEKIGVQSHHTTRDVSDIASKIHPLVSLRDKY